MTSKNPDRKQFVKVYTDWDESEKVMSVTLAARGLYASALTAAKRHQTDGLITELRLQRLCLGDPEMSAGTLAGQLVEAGLWHETTDDRGRPAWQIHDYEDHQETTADVAAKREEWAKKKRDQRKQSPESPETVPLHVPEDMEGTPPKVPRQDNKTEDIRQETKDKREEETQSAGADVARVFAHWQQITGHTRSKLDSKRSGKVKTALKAFTADQLCHAIDGWQFSSFHRGQNEDGTVYDNLSLILRDSEQIEKFMRYADDRSDGKGRQSVADAWDAAADDVLTAHAQPVETVAVERVP